MDSILASRGRFFWVSLSLASPRCRATCSGSTVQQAEKIVLPPTFFGASALPIWYGWASRPNIHWIVPIVGSSFFTVGVITLFNAVLIYLGMAYPAHAASVCAGNGLLRSLFGMVFPLFVSLRRPISSLPISERRFQ